MDVNLPKNSPIDNGGSVARIFLLFGIGVLLPFNIVLSCMDFYIEKMPGYQPASVFTFAINLPSWLTQILITVYGQNISYSSKVIFAFILQLIMILPVPFLANIGGGTGYYTTMIALAIFGVGSGVAQVTVFSMGAKFPFKYMAAIMLGNGIAGIGSNILRVITLLIFPASDEGQGAFFSTLSMFTFGVLILVACVFAQICLNKNSFAKYYLD